eukprot:9066448-Pyramimonas_sp.AAC.1
MSKWAEEAGALEQCQWGFRPQRQTVDMIIIARTLSEEATSGDTESVADPVCLLAFDIKKAYPNASRTVAWETCRRLGFPADAIQLLSGLHSLT